MATETRYPLRQILCILLRNLILSSGVPAINAALAGMEATDRATIPVFGDSSVILGEIAPTKEPIICITAGSFQTKRIAGMYYKTLYTQIKVKTVQIADDAPEDFSLCFNSIEDALTDLLCSQAKATLQPINPETSARLLPVGLAYQDCWLTGGVPLTFPGAGPDKITRYQGWLFSHVAHVPLGRLRPDALGL